jgi:hypothetical protein
MSTYNGTTENKENKGVRVRWPPYTPKERVVLQNKFLGDWKNLDFLETFWNPIYDEVDLVQYRRTAEAWRLRLSGKAFGSISTELGIDERKACALVSGRNLHPHLVQMYLNGQVLSKPKTGLKWILYATPKPTNMFPKTTLVPEKIQSYHDILDFLKRFPPVPANHPAVKYFGRSIEWVEQHRPELFGFLLGFIVGDAGKNYPEYEYRRRHYQKTALTTNMARSESNKRILRYIQLCLSAVGISSQRKRSPPRNHQMELRSQQRTHLDLAGVPGVAGRTEDEQESNQDAMARRVPKRIRIRILSGSS